MSRESRLVERELKSVMRMGAWSAKRAIRRHPLALNGSFDEGQSLLFKLAGANLLYSRNLPHVVSGQRSDHGSSPVKLLPLEEWILLVQRYFGVTLTHLIERGDSSAQMSADDLFKSPQHWVLGHLLLKADLRKANTSREQLINALFNRIECAMDDPLSRLFSGLRLLHPSLKKRKIQKMFTQIGSTLTHPYHSSPALGILELCDCLELSRQVKDTVVWLLCYLHDHPTLCDHIFEELRENLDTRAYHPDDLHTLPKLHCLILETLRLAPPHWISDWGPLSLYGQSASAWVSLDKVTPETRLTSSPLSSHLDPMEWPSPFTLEYQRFLPVSQGAPLPYSFMPFGRNFLSDQRLSFVLHTVTAIASSILRRGRLLMSIEDAEKLKIIFASGSLYEHCAHGISFGSPSVRFHFSPNDRFIHIPSARI